MTRNIATVEALNVAELISKLHRLGFELLCPNIGCAIGFSADGSGPLHLDTHEVTDFLVEGNGIVLWRGASESIYVSLIAGKPRIGFGGFTVAEEDTLRNALAQIGVNFSVAHEDSAYEV